MPDDQLIPALIDAFGEEPARTILRKLLEAREVPVAWLVSAIDMKIGYLHSVKAGNVGRTGIVAGFVARIEAEPARRDEILREARQAMLDCALSPATYMRILQKTRER